MRVTRLERGGGSRAFSTSATRALRPHALYSMLADLLGARPMPRARLLAELRRALVRLVDEHQIQPIIVLDDAQRLSDDVLAELASLVNIDFDGRDPGSTSICCTARCSWSRASCRSTSCAPAIRR